MINNKNQSLELSIVIVNWNVSHYLYACINSLKEHLCNISYEIIVVDNNSSDGSVDMLENLFPDIRLIKLKENLGYAKGNNIGISAAEGRFVIILNPDTLVINSQIDIFNEYINNNEVGAIGPLLVNEDGSIQYFCARKSPSIWVHFWANALRLKKLPILGSYFRKKYLSPYSYNRRQKVDIISGSAMIIKKKVLEECNGFSTVYLHTGEDVDLCERIRSKGYQIIFDPRIKILHFGGKSSEQDFINTQIKSYLSEYLFYKNRRNDTSAIAFVLITKFIDIPLSLLIALLKRLLMKIDYKSWRKTLDFAILIWKFNFFKHEEMK